MTQCQRLSCKLVVLCALFGCSSGDGTASQPGTTSGAGSTAAASGATAAGQAGTSAQTSASAPPAGSGAAGSIPPTTSPGSSQAGAPSAGRAGSSAAGSGSGAGGASNAGAAGMLMPTAAAGSSGAAASGTGGTGATMDATCNPSDKTPDATLVTGVGTGAKPTGKFNVVVEQDPGLKDHTVYRPEPFGMMKFPVLAWGNGGCSKMSTGFGEFLMEVASHGFVIIADGTPTSTGMDSGDATALIQAIDWAEKENDRACSKYYHQLSGKFAVSGQSCGGLMAINASTDKRITTSMPMNSGLLARDQKLYDALHAPMAIIDGGPDDIAYANGQADFMAINNIPILFANAMTGHGGTYWDDNGGEFAQVATAWLSWWLLDDQGATGKGMFIGDSCGLCGKSNWTRMWKMEPK